MMPQLIHRISDDGYFVEDVLLELQGDGTYPAIPSDCVTTHPAEGMQWPRWVNGAWVDAGVPYARDPGTGDLLIPTDE